MPFRILVVEDDSAVRATMEMLLSAIGLNQLLAADGVAAIEQVERVHHDIKISYLGQTRTSGGELVTKLRKTALYIPVIIVFI